MPQNHPTPPSSSLGGFRGRFQGRPGGFGGDTTCYETNEIICRGGFGAFRGNPTPKKKTVSGQAGGFGAGWEVSGQGYTHNTIKKYYILYKLYVETFNDILQIGVVLHVRHRREGRG